MREVYNAPKETDLVLSSGAPKELMFFALFAGFVFRFEVDFLRLLAGLFLVALMLQGLWFWAVRRFRRKLPASRDLLDLVMKAQQKLGCKRKVEVWSKDNKRPIIVSAATPLYNTILLSPPALDAILAHPEHGEVVLATHLAKIENTQLTLRVLRTAGAFMFFAFTQGVFIDFFLSGIPEVLAHAPLQLLAFCVTYPWGFLAIAIRKLEDRWRERVIHCYGLGPEVATFYAFAPESYDDTTRANAVAGFTGETGSEKLLAKTMRYLGISVILGAFSYIFLATVSVLQEAEAQALATLVAGLIFCVPAIAASYAVPGYEKRLHIEKEPLPLDDEKSRRLRTIICRELGVKEITISGYEEDGFGAVEVSVPELYATELLLYAEWDALDEPELAAAYLEAEFENRMASRSPNRQLAAIVVLALLWVIWVPVTGFLYVVGSWFAGPAAVILFSWIVTDLIALAAVVGQKKRRLIEVDLRHASRGPHLLEAIDRLAVVEGNRVYKGYSRRAARIREYLALQASHPDDSTS